MQLKSLSARAAVCCILASPTVAAKAQTPPPANPGGGAVSKVWVADNGDGTYKNPIIHADYSDPDAVRVFLAPRPPFPAGLRA